MNATPAAPAQAAPAQAATPAATPAAAKLEHETFSFPAGTSPEVIGAAFAKSSAGIPTTAQFNNIPDGNILPTRLTEIRVSYSGETPVAITVYQTPSFDEYMSSAEGVSALNDILLSGQRRKMSACIIAAINRKDKATKVVLPSTLIDFISVARGEASESGIRRFDMAIFNHFAAALCKSIIDKAAAKGKRINITKDQLKLALSNKAYAGSVYPQMPDAFWTNQAIPFLKSQAPLTLTAKDGKVTTHEGKVFDYWLETRDQVADVEGETLDDLTI